MGTQASVSLSTFIVANNALIVDQCEAFARTLGPVADDMTRAALRDHLGKILSDIAADMLLPQTERERAAKSKGLAPQDPDALELPAETHGALRAASGFNLVQTAAEYRALRATVIRMWLGTSPPLGPPQVEELTRFNEAMDQALAESLLYFAAAAAKARNLFLGVLGHELRTPLATIVGCAQTIPHVANAQLVREATDRILRGGKRIQSVLDDLLEFVGVSGKKGMRVTLAAMRMDDLCGRVAHDIEAAFPGRRVMLHQSGDMRGVWDEQRLAQALSNLMSNAVKYGAADSEITVTLAAGPDDVSVSVHNEGPVILPLTLESLFQPLVRGGAHDPTGYSLGLGLFIVREIVTAHGGTVEVSSSEADGTVFRFTLPRQPVLDALPAFGHMGAA